MILNKGDARIKSDKYRFMTSYDNIIKQAITNNINIKYYKRKNYDKINKIILRININRC